MSHSKFVRRAPVLISLLLAATCNAPAATVVWTNTAGGNWNNTNNWSPNTIPASGDTAFITNAGTYTVTLNANATLASLNLGGTNGTQTLTNNGFTLSLSGSSVFDTNGVFGFASGTLGGAGELLVKGRFTWTGGNMGDANGGKTVFTNSATVAVSGLTAKYHLYRTVDNYTTVAVTGGFLGGYGAVWNNKNGAVVDLQGDVSLPYYGFGGLATFNNSGTLKKSAGAAASSVASVVTNSGTVRSESGVLNLPQSYVQTAGLTELAGGNFSGGLLDIQGGLLTGPGNLAANVRSAAQVAPGTGVGRLTISNNIVQTYTATTNSLLTFQIGGLNPGSGHDQLRLNNGTATLAGTLRAELANAYVPTPGNAYTVMTFTARSGTFTNFSFPDYDFNVLQTATNIILIASNAPPAVSLVAPSNQLVCAQFPLLTSASDLDGTITNLTLLFNTNVLATFTNGASRRVLVTCDYPSTVTFTARATDSTGAVRETNFSTVFVTLPLHTVNLGGKLTNGQFKFCMLGEAGKTYDVLLNTNLSSPGNWDTIGVMENTNGIWRFTDPDGTNFGPRYYRARQQP